AQIPFNVDRGERGNSGIDFPHVAGVAMVYELPFYKNQSGALGRLMGGWQINTTYRYSTGQPFSVVQSRNSGSLCDPSNTWNSSRDACRPILNSESAPLTSVGKCTDPTLPDCGLIDFATLT